jgi:hypothetical protein
MAPSGTSTGFSVTQWPSLCAAYLRGHSQKPCAADTLSPMPTTIFGRLVTARTARMPGVTRPFSGAKGSSSVTFSV